MSQKTLEAFLYRLYWDTDALLDDCRIIREYYMYDFKTLMLLCSRGLISCVKHMSDHCPQTEKQEPILRSFCSFEYIFKFIIQSRLLFARATGGQNEDSFRVDVDTLMESFARMLNCHKDNIEMSQVGLALLLMQIPSKCTRFSQYF